MSVTLYADELYVLIDQAFKEIQPFVRDFKDLIFYVKKVLAGLVLAGSDTTGQNGALQLLTMGAPDVSYLNRKKGRLQSRTIRSLQKSVGNTSNAILSPLENDASEIKGPLPTYVKAITENSDRNDGQSAILEQQSSDFQDLFLSRISNTRTTINEVLKQSIGAAIPRWTAQKNLSNFLSTQSIMQLSQAGF